MPTKGECQELIDNTTHSAGFLFGGYVHQCLSKKDTAIWVLLPFTGYYTNGWCYEAGSEGYCWSSMLYAGTRAFNLYFRAELCKTSDSLGYFALSVCGVPHHRRMPTKAEFEELLRGTYAGQWEPGPMPAKPFLSKKDGVSEILLPTAGYYWDDTLELAGYYGSYRSSSSSVYIGEPHCSTLSFSADSESVSDGGFRHSAESVRGVLPYSRAEAGACRPRPSARSS